MTSLILGYPPSPNSKFEAFLVQRFNNCPSWPPGGANVPRARVCTRDDSIILMDHRIHQTGLHLQMFIYYKYTKRQTYLWKWSYLQRQVMEVRGLGRHAVLASVLWWRWSWWRRDRRCLVGRLWRTKRNVRDSSAPGFLDIETDLYWYFNKY